MSYLSDATGSMHARVSALLLSLVLVACGTGESTTPETGLASASVTSETEPPVQLQNNVAYSGEMVAYDQVFFLEVPEGTPYLQFSLASIPSCYGSFMPAMDVGFDSIPAGNTSEYCNMWGKNCTFIAENPAAGVWWVRVGIDDSFPGSYGSTAFSLKGAYGGAEVLEFQADEGISGPSQMCIKY
ncbi:hypothetical protein HPC49_16435 [Pyxidicoccus fallax]|uniref:Uncharacterized protein n=1 Tax=Pyxidicoccus fallax TaxID=394095 RepID=A0A848L7W3_9BACT|nr:hypothetical protein [Pyxidicoccus fallax]NMO15080.1 hypothetical protein [Pyxidicoccus fallax]NPC79806.1 hypothetical protein [Pyxidicoccus fallax]